MNNKIKLLLKLLKVNNKYPLSYYFKLIDSTKLFNTKLKSKLKSKFNLLFNKLNLIKK